MRASELQRLDYRPAEAYGLDLEIFSVSELRERVGMEPLRSAHRYAFYMILCVTRGESTHMIDFRMLTCKRGSLLLVHPGQAHSFGLQQDWDGWMVLFRPEFIQSAQPLPDLGIAVGADRLDEHLSLHDDELRMATEATFRMREDAKLNAPPTDVHALLRYQLYALLLRLKILHGRKEVRSGASARTLKRFQEFQQLRETKFARWHQVADYAHELRCSEKSLTRASMELAGSNAKAFITSRITLEAKRLLVHTTLSVRLIGERLGFEEATNFIKFFRREAGCTPAEFRRRQLVGMHHQPPDPKGS